MDAEEREIYYYLKGWKDQFISSREICRRAGGKRRYQREPEWAKSVLTRMVERGILEVDGGGHYRIKPFDESLGAKKRRKWVSPHIAKILKESGKDFTEIVMSDDELDRYYDSL